MRRLAAALGAFLLAGCATQYVPDDGWDVVGVHSSSAEKGRSYERWWGKQLAAMGEPSLSSTRDLRGFSQRFRLTVLPTFTPGFAARIDRSAEGNAMLHWVILDGAGGYDPGKVADRGARPLSEEEISHFEESLRAAALASLSMEDRRQVITQDPETGIGTITICLDGTTYLFELLGYDGRYFIERSCVPEEGGLIDLMKETHGLMPDDFAGDLY